MQLETTALIREWGRITSVVYIQIVGDVLLKLLDLQLGRNAKWTNVLNIIVVIEERCSDYPFPYIGVFSFSTSASPLLPGNKSIFNFLPSHHSSLFEGSHSVNPTVLWSWRVSPPSRSFQKWLTTLHLWLTTQDFHEYTKELAPDKLRLRSCGTPLVFIDFLIPQSLTAFTVVEAIYRWSGWQRIPDVD